jgi:hypothetical protein
MAGGTWFLFGRETENVDVGVFCVRGNQEASVLAANEVDYPRFAGRRPRDSERR